MEVKEAARMAKEYIADLFADEEIADIGLEEIEFDHESNLWVVTVGFSLPRKWRNDLAMNRMDRGPARAYRLIRINNHNGLPESVADRPLFNPFVT
jgi:hypothetical protein